MNINKIIREKILLGFSQDINEELEKGRHSDPIGTVSEKTGLTKVKKDKWVLIQNKDNLKEYKELTQKFYSGTITPDEQVKMRKLAEKEGISTGLLLNQYHTKKESDKLKEFVKLGFDKFDFTQVKTDLDNLFDNKGKLELALTQEGTIYFSYKNKGVQKLERQFIIRHGKLVVEHTAFMLDQKEQNRGFGKVVLKSAYEQYKKCNINSIETFANSEVGGYCWANYGFSMLDKDAIDEFIYTNIDVNYSNNAKIWQQNRKLIRDTVNEYYKVHDNNSPFPMILLSKLTNDQGEEIGKELLMGSAWDGYLFFEDKEQCKVLEEYLKNEKKSKEYVSEKLTKLPAEIESEQIFKKDILLDRGVLNKFFSDIIRQKVSKEEFFKRYGNLEELDVNLIAPTEKLLNKKELLKDTENEFVVKYKGKYYSLTNNTTAGKILANNEKIKAYTYTII